MSFFSNKMDELMGGATNLSSGGLFAHLCGKKFTGNLFEQILQECDPDEQSTTLLTGERVESCPDDELVILINCDISGTIKGDRVVIIGGEINARRVIGHDVVIMADTVNIDSIKANNLAFAANHSACQSVAVKNELYRVGPNTEGKYDKDSVQDAVRGLVEAAIEASGEDADDYDIKSVKVKKWGLKKSDVAKPAERMAPIDATPTPAQTAPAEAQQPIDVETIISQEDVAVLLGNMTNSALQEIAAVCGLKAAMTNASKKELVAALKVVYVLRKDLQVKILQKIAANIQTPTEEVEPQQEAQPEAQAETKPEETK